MANSLTINSASISPTIFKPGDTVKVTFKVTNSASSKKNLMSLDVGLGLHSNYTTYFFSSTKRVKTSIKPGASATLTASYVIGNASSTFKDPEGDPYEENGIQRLVSQGQRTSGSIYFGVTGTMFGVEQEISGDFYITKAVSGTVMAITYKPGIVNGLRIMRVSGDGQEDDESEVVAVTTQLSQESAPPAGLFSCKLYYAPDRAAKTTDSFIDLTDSIATLLNGVTNDRTLVTQAFSAGSDWHFLLTYGDAYESASPATASISEAFANLHLSGASTGGIAMGKFSSATEGVPLFECEYPAHFASDVTVPSGKLLKSVKVSTSVSIAKSDSGSQTGNVSIEVSPGTGWTAVGVIGFYLSNGATFASRVYLSSGKVVIYYRHNGTLSSAITLTLQAWVLCVHTG